MWSITGMSEDDALAVGYAGTVLSYDGLSWSRIESGTSYWLQDVWVFAENDAISVGDGGIILRYAPDSGGGLFR